MEVFYHQHYFDILHMYRQVTIKINGVGIWLSFKWNIYGSACLCPSCCGLHNMQIVSNNFGN